MQKGKVCFGGNFLKKRALSRSSKLETGEINIFKEFSVKTKLVISFDVCFEFFIMKLIDYLLAYSLPLK